MHVYAAEETVAIDVDFWCVNWQVIRMDSAVLYLEVMPTKKAYAADVDAKAKNAGMVALPSHRRPNTTSTNSQRTKLGT